MSYERTCARLTYQVTLLKEYYRDYAEFLASGEGSSKRLVDLPELFFFLEEKVLRFGTRALPRLPKRHLVYFTA